MVRNENNIFISVCSVHLSGIARIFMNLFSVPALCNSDNNGTTSADSGFTYLIISGHKQFCVQKPSSLPEQPQTTSPTDFLQQNKEGPQSPPQSNPKSYITKLPCLLQTKHVPTHWAKTNRCDRCLKLLKRPPAHHPFHTAEHLTDVFDHFGCPSPGRNWLEQVPPKACFIT